MTRTRRALLAAAVTIVVGSCGSRTGTADLTRTTLQPVVKEPTITSAVCYDTNDDEVHCGYPHMVEQITIQGVNRQDTPALNKPGAACSQLLAIPDDALIIGAETFTIGDQIGLSCTIEYAEPTSDTTAKIPHPVNL